MAYVYRLRTYLAILLQVRVVITMYVASKVVTYYSGVETVIGSSKVVFEYRHKGEGLVWISKRV